MFPLDVLQGRAEAATAEIVERRVAAKEVTDAAPGLDLAEGPEGDYLEEPVLRRTGLRMITNLLYHILADSIGGAEDVAELVLPQDWVVSPRPGLPGDAPLKDPLPLGREFPIVFINTLSRPWRTLHMPP